MARILRPLQSQGKVLFFQCFHSSATYPEGIGWARPAVPATRSAAQCRGQRVKLIGGLLPDPGLNHPASSPGDAIRAALGRFFCKLSRSRLPQAIRIPQQEVHHHPHARGAVAFGAAHQPIAAPIRVKPTQLMNHVAPMLAPRLRIGDQFVLTDRQTCI